MVRCLYGLLIAIVLSGCSGIDQYYAPMAGEKTIIYIMGRNRSVLGGSDLRVCDRWSYNNKTGELKLERSDSSTSESKSVIEAIKGLPAAIPIPY